MHHRNREMNMRRYEVSRREPIVACIVEALERCGARVLSPPDPRSAPFEIEIEVPTGERLLLICYAFLANKYLQENRPPDEHRFQVKYGSEFEEYHELYIADGRDAVTLMFGVHLKEGVFIAVDPAMHALTRFSRSVEFKTGHVENTKQLGWYGWERDRSSTRRRMPAPMEDCRVEVLLGFTPEKFLQYVAFERIATGLDPGERLLLVDRVRNTPQVLHPDAQHPLEVQLGLSAREILDVISGAFRLAAAVRGSVAEHHLANHLRGVPGVRRVVPIDRDGEPDIELYYKSREPILIECKNALRQPPADGIARVDFQKTRAAKGDPCSRYYRPDQFDVLAACLHPVTERWEFGFCFTANLTPHSTCEGRLSSRVIVRGPDWKSSIESLLEEWHR